MVKTDWALGSRVAFHRGPAPQVTKQRKLHCFSVVLALIADVVNVALNIHIPAGPQATANLDHWLLLTEVDTGHSLSSICQIQG